MQEEFRDVVGYEDRFMISNTGILYSKVRSKILSQYTNPAGYKVHATKIGGRRGIAVLLRVHRLVAEAFIPNPENKPFVNHIDGNKQNNSVENLEWVTSKENMRHAFDTGLIKSANCITHPSKGKLSKEDVDFIRSNCKKNGGKFSFRQLGKMFNMTHKNISYAVYGITYSSY